MRDRDRDEFIVAVAATAFLTGAVLVGILVRLVA